MNAKRLATLTLQDVIWINLQVSRTVNRFRYADLEDAVFAQYGYGESVDLAKQAAAFFRALIAKAPFTAGNEATALIALAGFLAINGRRLTWTSEDALAWIERFESIQAADIEASSEVVTDGPIFESAAEHGEPDVPATLEDALQRYAGAIEILRAVPA